MKDTRPIIPHLEEANGQVRCRTVTIHKNYVNKPELLEKALNYLPRRGFFKVTVDKWGTMYFEKVTTKRRK